MEAMQVHFQCCRCEGSARVALQKPRCCGQPAHSRDGIASVETFGSVKYPCVRTCVRQAEVLARRRKDRGRLLRHLSFGAFQPCWWTIAASLRETGTSHTTTTSWSPSRHVPKSSGK